MSQATFSLSSFITSSTSEFQVVGDSEFQVVGDSEFQVWGASERKGKVCQVLQHTSIINHQQCGHD